MRELEDIIDKDNYLGIETSAAVKDCGLYNPSRGCLGDQISYKNVLEPKSLGEKIL